MRLPYLVSVTNSSPSPALRHRRGVSDGDGRDRADPVLVATATATDSLATLAHPSGIGRVAPATAHPARFFLAGSDPDARRVASCPSKILTRGVARATRLSPDQPSHSG